MKSEIDVIIDKSRRAIRSSERELNDKNYDYACSRAYYAVFYLLEGVLLLDNRAFSKHSAVISVFNRDFIKTGKFPVEFSKYIKYLAKRREIGDYSFSIRVKEEDAVDCIAKAKVMFKDISAFLRKQTQIQA